MRILLLTTDAYGGHGGIALYNRDIADALAEMPEVTEIVVVPRTMPLAPTGIPDKVRFLAAAVGSKWRYVLASLRAAAGHFDLVICGHINLLPLADLLNRKLRAPLVLMAYGIDVWTAPGRRAQRALRSVAAVWSISALTRDRMNEWAGLPVDRYHLLPNAIHLERYGTGAKNQELLQNYGLVGRRVLLTLARLPSKERYKGVDEVLEALAVLSETETDLAYLVVGEGDDRRRLEAKAEQFGLAQRVAFSGFVPESAKAEHFRLADAFVMPGRGEGFGFVFLEAMACGVPVVGSCLDGSREALRDGLLGVLVDPTEAASVRSGILQALQAKRGVPEGLEYFEFARFRERLAAAVHSALPTHGATHA